MFKSLLRNADVMYPIIYSDQHTTSPEQTASSIKRNERSAVQAPPRSSDLYDRARSIFYRAQINRQFRWGASL